MAQQQIARHFLSYSRTKEALHNSVYADATSDKAHEIVRDLCFLVDQGVAKAQGLPGLHTIGDPKKHVLAQLKAHIAKLEG
jgi:hypothetical protein